MRLKLKSDCYAAEIGHMSRI